MGSWATTSARTVQKQASHRPPCPDRRRRARRGARSHPSSASSSGSATKRGATPRTWCACTGPAAARRTFLRRPSPWPTWPSRRPCPSTRPPRPRYHYLPSRRPWRHHRTCRRIRRPSPTRASLCSLARIRNRTWPTTPRPIRPPQEGACRRIMGTLSTHGSSHGAKRLTSAQQTNPPRGAGSQPALLDAVCPAAARIVARPRRRRRRARGAVAAQAPVLGARMQRASVFDLQQPAAAPAREERTGRQGVVPQLRRRVHADDGTQRSPAARQVQAAEEQLSPPRGATEDARHPKPGLKAVLRCRKDRAHHGGGAVTTRERLLRGGARIWGPSTTSPRPCLSPHHPTQRARRTARGKQERAADFSPLHCLVFSEPTLSSTGLVLFWLQRTFFFCPLLFDIRRLLWGDREQL